MDLLITIIINIFIGALLYVVISLKLEKSSSEFREKRLRKEMDDIIKEFNITAERNISLLENRIAILKKLLKKSGDLSSLDISINDDVDERSAGLSPEGTPEIPVFFHERRGGPTGQTIPVNGKTFDNPEKKGLILFIEKIINFIYEIKRAIKNNPVQKNVIENKRVDVSDGNVQAVTAGEPGGTMASRVDMVIEKDFTDITLKDVLPRRMNIDEIRDIIETEDKFTMISRLHKNGLTADEIARYSGVPEGEVKLVVNISNTR